MPSHHESMYTDALVSMACRDSADAYIEPVLAPAKFVEDHETDAQAVIQDHGERVTIAFRGSSSRSDWIGNMLVPLTQVQGLSPGACAHMGFLRQYRSLHNRILAHLAKTGATRVTLTGHSLGGAIAVIAAACLPEHVSCDLITFGAPRPGNRNLSECALKRCVTCVRVVNDRDIVPCMPPQVFGFQHVCAPFQWIKHDGTVSEQKSEQHLVAQLLGRLFSALRMDFGIRDHFIEEYLAFVPPDQRGNDREVTVQKQRKATEPVRRVRTTKTHDMKVT